MGVLERRIFVGVKRLGLLTATFLILITPKIYAPKENYIAEEETTIEEKPILDEELDNLTDESPDIEETQAVFAYSSLSDEVVETITGISYKENNKIRIEDLSYLQISYWGFDDKEHVGEIILNKAVAEDVLEIFKELYDAKFPIDKIRLIDEYGADDELSMLDNNTSAFCYREIGGSKGTLSKHGHGVAIDINPVQNPYVKNNLVLPESGRRYLDRTNVRKGMIVKGDVCYEAFKERGWTWGGDWNSLKDYQHFEFKLD